ncbi:MAG: DUF433 domain-containing protein [Blastocatellia bacterium]|nr:DUF433 domain-containing protein [Blastocatellia bacterium]
MFDKYVEKLEHVYRVKDTRIALDSLIYQFRAGRSPEAIQDAFPTLSLSQVYGALAFYLENQAELDAYLSQQEASEEIFSAELARLFPKGAALKSRIKQLTPEPAQ